MPKQLTQDKQGRFLRSLGPVGNQHKFRVGRDRAAAVVRIAMLEQLWQAVCDRYDRGEWDGTATPPARAWDDTSLAIGRAIAQGEPLVRIEPPVDMLPALVLHWLTTWRNDVPFVRLELADEEQAQAVVEQAVNHASKLREHARRVLVVSGNQSLHPALKAYAEYVRAEYTVAGLLSAWGRTQLGMISFVSSHLPDVRLGELDILAVESCLSILRKRPAARTHSAKGIRPVSRKYASNSIKQFRAFLSWLHKSAAWEWRRPDDYEVKPVKIARHESDRRVAGPRQVSTYSLDELALLWAYATPRVRAYMALALNCAFGGAEIASLRVDELFEGRHPHADSLGLVQPDGVFVMRQRRKTDVYAEWRLWPVAVQAVSWLQAQRPKSSSPLLALTKQGNPLDDGTKNNFLQNLWNRTLDRVQKDHPSFPRLSFNKLRKTSGNLVRSESGGEIAALQLAHGQPTRDDQLEVYTDRPFAKLHSCLWAVNERLARVWASVADPFPDGPEQVWGPNVSRGTISRIQKLSSQGHTVSGVAEKCRVSTETVRRWRNRRPVE